jgi:hypothetical protein
VFQKATERSDSYIASANDTSGTLSSIVRIPVSLKRVRFFFQRLRQSPAAARKLLSDGSMDSDIRMWV